MNLHDLQELLDIALANEIAGAIDLRHRLHRRPEPSGREDWTGRQVAASIPCEMTPIAGTGRIGRLGPAGPAVAIRAELDALPIPEATGVPFASVNGNMHACGHDVHLAALTAVARAANHVDLPTGLVLILQPREETAPSGASDIASSGALEAHHTHAVIGVHLQPQLDRGVAAADAGVVNAGSDEFHITITGTGGHGGYPHLATDPVPALCQTIQLLLQTTRTTVDPMHPAVISIGTLNAGHAANVIPEHAEARGTIRTFFGEDQQQVHSAMRAAVESTAAAFGCTGTVTVTPVEPPLVNDPGLADACLDWLKDAQFDPAPEFRSCGSDDFAFYSQAAPSQMIFLGTGPGSPNLHDSRFLPDDDLVADVARAMMAGYLAAVETL